MQIANRSFVQKTVNKCQALSRFYAKGFLKLEL